jgi:hypothetical protein
LLCFENKFDNGRPLNFSYFIFWGEQQHNE